MERDEFDRLTRSILNDAYAGTQLGASQLNVPIYGPTNAVTYCIDMMLEKTLCSDYPPEQLSRDMEIVTELRELVHTLNDWKD